MTSLMRRPAFRIGDKLSIRMPPLTAEQIEKSLPTPRNVNIRMIRKSFEITGPSPRRPLGIKETESLLSRQQGIKVRLGEETLKKFFQVEVPQIGPDGKTIKDSSGNILMTKKLINIGELSLSIAEGFGRLEQLITNISSATGRDIQDLENRLTLEIGNIIDRAISDKDFAKFTPRNLELLKRVIKELNIDPNPINAGIPVKEGLFIDIDIWRSHGPQILIWLISTLPPGVPVPGARNIGEPAIGVSGFPIKYQTILESFERGRVLDIRTLQFFNNPQDIRDLGSVPVTGGVRARPSRGLAMPEEKIPEEKLSEPRPEEKVFEGVGDLASLGSDADIESIGLRQASPEKFTVAGPRRSERIRSERLKREISDLEDELTALILTDGAPELIQLKRDRLRTIIMKERAEETELKQPTIPEKPKKIKKPTKPEKPQQLRLSVRQQSIARKREIKTLKDEIWLLVVQDKSPELVKTKQDRVNFLEAQEIEEGPMIGKS